jgi:hypothetical protein
VDDGNPEAGEDEGDQRAEGCGARSSVVGIAKDDRALGNGGQLRTEGIAGVCHPCEFFSGGAFDAVGNQKCTDLGGSCFLVQHQAHGGGGFAPGEGFAGVGSATDFTEERSEFVAHDVRDFVMGRVGLRSDV